jgi:hypothetical protein
VFESDRRALRKVAEGTRRGYRGDPVALGEADVTARVLTMFGSRVTIRPSAGRTALTRRANRRELRRPKPAGPDAALRHEARRTHPYIWLIWRRARRTQSKVLTAIRLRAAADVL